GIVFLNLLFQIEVCSEVVEISNIGVSSKAIENTISGDIFHQFSWTDGIDETINLNTFKPSSEQDEHILNISLYCSFEGTIVLNGIDFDIYLGLSKIASGVISIAQQNGEIQLIETITYTDNYQIDLSITFSAGETGSGTVTLYNSSQIEIEDISHVNTEKYLKLLEEGVSFSTPTYGSLTKNYVDIVYIENTSLPFQLEFLMELSASTSGFQSIVLSVYADDSAITTKSISDVGDVHIFIDVELTEGYNEIKFVLNIIGQGSTVTFENMRYTLEQGINDTLNPLIPEDEFNIPFFKVPKNIFLGIFVLFDCWLVMGILLRIYKGRKLRKNQQTENDEFILEIVQLSQD
ncbi:MAG: hypothetical protein GOP50_09965, partial [Candidatus Heimdallarchaeota archaeon]|nr:hypothetical protein [Candidatus Heimdallarchaeota archaeon]